MSYGYRKYPLPVCDSPFHFCYGISWWTEVLHFNVIDFNSNLLYSLCFSVSLQRFFSSVNWKGHFLLLLSKSLKTLPNFESFRHLELIFGMWCGVGVQIPSFLYEYPVVSASVIYSSYFLNWFSVSVLIHLRINLPSSTIHSSMPTSQNKYFVGILNVIKEIYGSIGKAMTTL